MVILGIDPGIASLGYGVIDYTRQNDRMRALEYGTFKTSAGVELPLRLLDIHRFLEELISKHKPDAMAVEELFFNTNAKTALMVGHARGVVLLSAADNGIPMYEYTPLQVKQAVVGYGRAEKQQVQQMVKVMLGLASIPKPDDTADALAISICHGFSSGLQSAVSATLGKDWKG